MTIDFKKLAAPFQPEKVHWRVGTVSREKPYGMALAYIDARDVMDRLDAVCGPEGWQCRYSHANGKTVCEIGIKVGDEWIWKADGAGDTDYEAEKGALSTAFKRAAVRWGIGRYLYDLPTPWVQVEKRGKSVVIVAAEAQKLQRLLPGSRVETDAPQELAQPAKPNGATRPAHVPVPLDIEGAGSDWRHWAQHDMPERIRACQSPEEVQAVLDANKNSLDNLKSVSEKAHDGLVALAMKAIEAMKGRAT